MAKFKVEETGTRMLGKAIYTYEVEANSEDDAIRKVQDWEPDIKLVDTTIEIDSIDCCSYKIKK